MIKLYLIVFSNTLAQKDVTAALDKNSDIEFWFFNLPQSVFVKTKLTSLDLFSFMESTFGEQTVFITEVSKYNHQGRLPKDHWQYF